MPKGGSGHYFRMTGHQYTHRGYCACCANYRALQRYPTNEYYCRSCTTHITKELHKRGMEFEQIAQHPEWAPVIDEIANARQDSLSHRKKTTEREFKSPWKPEKRKKQ